MATNALSSRDPCPPASLQPEFRKKIWCKGKGKDECLKQSTPDRNGEISKLTVAQHHFSAFQNGADDLLCVLSWMSSRSCGRFRGGRSRAGKNWQIPSVTGLD